MTQSVEERSCPVVGRNAGNDIRDTVSCHLYWYTTKWKYSQDTISDIIYFSNAESPCRGTNKSFLLHDLMRINYFFRENQRRQGHSRDAPREKIRANIDLAKLIKYVRCVFYQKCCKISWTSKLWIALHDFLIFAQKIINIVTLYDDMLQRDCNRYFIYTEYSIDRITKPYTKKNVHNVIKDT